VPNLRSALGEVCCPRGNMVHLIYANLLAFTFSLGTRMLLVFGTFILGFAIEQVAKVQPGNRRGVVFNCTCAVIYQALDMTFGAAVYLFVGGVMQKIPFLGFFWHLQVYGLWSLLFVAAFSITVSDFFYYWLHRLQHSSKWLWAEHELHHSEQHMNVTTAWRHHWLEGSLYMIFINVPMALLFSLPIEAAMLVNIMSKVVVSFAHLNSPIAFGWFTRVLCSPQSHRIHHSKSPEHIDKTFAVIFPIWDVIFGTYHHPAKNEWPETGLASGKTVASVPEAVVLPFLIWHGMIAEKLRLRRA
jgi:sterol desaturase/sphingolipid hydroxylase (fatty acid hydroxylase superfamily)